MIVMHELNLQLVFSALLQKVKLIILCTILGGLLLGGYTHFFTDPTYKSQVQMYVSNYTDLTATTSSVTASGLTTSQALVNEYIVVVKNDMVISEISDALRSKGYVMSNRAIRSAAALSSVNETAMLSVDVETTDPKLSKAICDSFAEVVPSMLQDTMEIGSVKVMAPAQLGMQTGPNMVGRVILGLILGFVLCCGVILLIFMMDNTVRNERELKKRLDIPVLGEIPTIIDETPPKEKKKNRREHHG